MSKTKALVWFLTAFLCAAWCSDLSASQDLPGHLQKAAREDNLAGPLGDEVGLDLMIGLPLRDPKGLDDFLKQVYDPHSFQYRKFLTPEEFTARFCPSPSDYESLADFLRSKGLTITGLYPNRLSIAARATVRDIRKTFGVNLNQYRRQDGRLFYAPDREPSLDSDIPLLHISGLDNFSEAKSKLRRGSPAGNGGAPKSGTDPSSLYVGQDFRDAYVPDVAPSLTGTGQRVALVEFDGYYLGDITFYLSLYTPVVSSPAPINVSIGGFNGTPVNSLDVDEVSLDIEMVNAIAPGAQVVVYEAAPNSNSDVSFDSMLQSMTQPPLCGQISSSWGGFGDSTARNLLNQLAAQGQAYFEASGDNGSYDVPGANPTPALGSVAGDPSLTLTSVETLVGGTKLFTTNPSSSPVYASETTWNDNVGAGGGGICTGLLAIPSYQSSVPMGANRGSTSWRNFPDVAAAAASILLVSNNYATLGGSGASYRGPIWGTSASSPLWAGFLALVNQQAYSSGKGFLGSVNNTLYSLALTPTTYANDFHDINDGSNNNYTNSGAATLYPAVTGFDLATGLGSPKGQALVSDLVGFAPTLTPTPLPCGWPGPTCTMTPTPTPTSTPTPTPTQILSKLGQAVLAPVPVSRGGKICLFPDYPILNSQWDVFNFTGESVAGFSFPDSQKNCWDTAGIGPGVYMVRIKLKYADGSDGVVWKKIIIKP